MPSLTTDSKSPKYRARVKYNMRELILGRFDSFEEAKRVEDSFWDRKGFPNGTRPWANQYKSCYG